MYNNIENYYRYQSAIYDMSRWSFLFGRKRLKNYLPDLADNARILDLGCGTGYQLQLLTNRYPNANITAIDRSTHMMGKAKSKIKRPITFLRQRYQKESFESGQFDLITCSYSLTMMEPQSEVLTAIHHHLKENGHLVVVDFDHSSFVWFRNWMKRNFVSLSIGLFENLNMDYNVCHFKTYKTFPGLWTYSIFAGQRRFSSHDDS